MKFHLYVFTAILFFLCGASAQESSNTKAVEKIEVTGSRIKRIDVEGPSPVLTIDSEDLVRSGYNSVSDVLRDTGVNSSGSFREHGSTVGGGTAAVDLRGLGQTRTLVLLNGQRLPTDAFNGSVDLNIIPMAAVERIEILKDGASAVYGSDALGGVVNIITKKEFDGFEIGGSTSFTEQGGGERRDLSLTHGYNTSKFSMTNVLFLRQNSRILAEDREWSKRGLSIFSSPGNYDAGSGLEYDTSKCPADQVVNGFCRYNFGDENWEMPDIFQASLMSDMTYKWNDSLESFFRLGYSYKNTVWVASPAATNGNTSFFAHTADGDLTTDPGATVNSVFYRFRELGNRKSDTKTNSGSVMTGLRGYVGDTWDWEANVSYNKIDRKERRVNGYALKQDIKDAQLNGDFDFWEDEGQRGDLRHLTYVPQQNSISENTFVELKSQGEIGQLGGPIGLAVGVQGLRELYRDGADDRTLNNEVLSIASSAGGGARNAVSAFSELGFQPLSNLETNLALRFDDYNDFGSTVNPKLAVRFTPFSPLMLRASAGTGFKAPQMQKLHAAQTSGNSTFIDQVWCETSGVEFGGTDTDACKPQQHPIVQGGNKNLKEEKSFSANFGAVYQAGRNHSLGFDFWYFDLTNAIEDTDYGAITRAEASGATLGDQGATADRNGTTGRLEGTGLFAPFLNTSGIETQGIDFLYNGKMKTKVGDFKIRFEHSQMIYFKTEPYPGTGVTNQLGLVSRPRWRNNTTFFYIPNPNHEISLLARTIGDHGKKKQNAGKHPVYTEYDLRYSYAIDSWAGKLTLGIKNLLGTNPPYDTSSPLDFDLVTGLYDERGRSLYVGYRQSF